MVFALRKILQKKKRLETFSDSRNGSLHPKTKKKRGDVSNQFMAVTKTNSFDGVDQPKGRFSFGRSPTFVRQPLEHNYLI